MPSIRGMIMVFLLILGLNAVVAWFGTIRDDYGYWRLEKAISEDDRETLSKALSTVGSPIGLDPVHFLNFAVHCDRPQIVGTLLSRPEIRALATDPELLRWAAANISPAMVRCLLENGVAFNASESFALVKMTLDNPHNFSKRPDEDQRHLELVKLLVDLGAFTHVPASETRALLAKPSLATLTASLEREGLVVKLLSGPVSGEPASGTVPENAVPIGSAAEIPGR